MLRGIFNTKQYESIISATKTKGITLIKGPPGTGKSLVVLGILSTLLSLKPKSKDKVFRKYTIKELLEHDSSDEEDYNKQGQ